MAKFLNHEEEKLKENKNSSFVDSLEKCAEVATKIFFNIEKIIGELIMTLVYVAEMLKDSLRDEILYLIQSLCSGCCGLGCKIRNKRQEYYEKNPEKKQARRLKVYKQMRRFISFRKRIVTKEKAIGTTMVCFINRVDTQNEVLADKTLAMAKEGNKKFNFAREWAEINKKSLLMKLGILLAIAIVGISIFDYCTAYEYSYNGRTLGLVKRQEDVLRIVDIVSEQLSKEHNAEIRINKETDIDFKRVVAINQSIDDTENVLKRLTYMRNINVKAYGIYINDVRAAIVDSKANAKKVLDIVTDLYLSNNPNTKYEKIGFKEKIKIKKIDTKLGRLENLDEVEMKLTTGAVAKKIHVVVAGETFSGIAKANGLTLEDIWAANPNHNPARLMIGDEIVLTKPVPMLTISTVEVTSYLAPIPYGTEYRDDAGRYKGEKVVKVKGINGEKNVTARITKENGIQVAAEELSSQVISNPVTEVVVRGTKELPPLQGTGKLRYPLSNYRLSSRFGPRWGRMHNGIDLAAPVGTRIGASDGGTVVYAGYSGSYGYVVKINHGGGITTVYAHCSKLLVKRGDKVYQGQHIANVGNTGRSTGPHCHFEVQVNGTPKNPLKYL